MKSDPVCAFNMRDYEYAEAVYCVETDTNTVDRLNAITSRLFTADPMLKTREEKRKVLAATPARVSKSGAVVCIIEAVTPESNVAIVVKSTYRDAFVFWASDIFAIPKL